MANHTASPSSRTTPEPAHKLKSTTQALRGFSPLSPHGEAVGLSEKTTFSPLLDTAPVEVRMMIFKLVLKAEHPVRISSRGPYAGRATEDYGHSQGLNTSLLRVNRQVSAEARDAFFDVNTILISEEDDKLRYLDDLRQVELLGTILKRFSDDAPGNGHPYDEMETLATQPRLRSLAIHCQGLLRPRVSTRDWLAQVVSPQVGIRCSQLGLFELSVPFHTNARIYLKDYVLQEALPSARRWLTDISREGLGPLGPLGGPEWANVFTSRFPHVRLFSHWLATYEGMRVHYDDRSPDELSPKDVAGVRWFEAHYPELDMGACSMVWRMPMDVRIVDLLPGKRDAAVLEWASDLMRTHLRIMLDAFQVTLERVKSGAEGGDGEDGDDAELSEQEDEDQGDMGGEGSEQEDDEGGQLLRCGESNGR